MVNWKNMTKKDFGKYFEPLLLGRQTEATIREGCKKAIEYNCRCVNAAPLWLPIVKEELLGTDVMVGAGIGFPLGLELPEWKAYIAKEYIQLGAESIDFVMNYGALQAGQKGFVQKEFQLMRDACEDKECKVIIEVANLTDDEIKTACNLAVQTGINWIKTSTGTIAGPTMEQLKVIFDTLKGSETRVKVSGVKDPKPQNAVAYISAGVEIIGSQSAFKIIDSFKLLKEMQVI